MKKFNRLFLVVICAVLCICLTACGGKAQTETTTQNITETTTETTTATSTTVTVQEETSVPETTTQATTQPTTQATTVAHPESEQVKFDTSWKYAEYSAVHTDDATLYYSKSEKRKGKVVCVNAGHGCRGASSYYTYCHPDKTPKVTGGSTAAGSIKATSNNEGTTLLDGTDEAVANLDLSLVLKQQLLDAGYDVLMVRTGEDSQLDVIARTVMANNKADCHISVHYDSTETDKGLFCCSVPSVQSYRDMEPVKSHYKEHLRIEDAIISGSRDAGVKVWNDGKCEIDLMQTSYSTVPSAVVEVGDRASNHSPEHQSDIAKGIVNGVNIFFEQ